MKLWTNSKIALLGNIPPRDVLAAGSPDDVQRAVTDMLKGLQDHSRLIVSCGGGMNAVWTKVGQVVSPPWAATGPG